MTHNASVISLIAGLHGVDPQVTSLQETVVMPVRHPATCLDPLPFLAGEDAVSGRVDPHNLADFPYLHYSIDQRLFT